jgi:hypothetical protein
LYPLPAIIAILIWGFVLYSTGTKMMLGGLTVTALGIIAFFIKSKKNKEWPFNSAH